MNKQKFTRGPWSYNKLTGLVSSNDIEQDIICDTMTTGEQWEEANANLIACAPEMYKFLDDLANGRGTDYPIEQLLAKCRGEHEAKD